MISHCTSFCCFLHLRRSPHPMSVGTKMIEAMRLHKVPMRAKYPILAKPGCLLKANPRNPAAVVRVAAMTAAPVLLSTKGKLPVASSLYLWWMCRTPSKQ